MKRLYITLLTSLSIISTARAQAQVSPLDVPVKDYGFLLGFAIFGGLVKWIGRVRAGELRPGQLGHLIGEMATSAFAGMLCFLLCRAANLDLWSTSALVGIAGHMGGKAVDEMERRATRKAKAIADAIDPAPPAQQ